MHPILARPRHVLLYLLLFLAVGVLLGEALARLTAQPRLGTLVLAVPLFLLHAFSCLASWYLCRSLPLTTTRVTGLVVAHLVAGLVSASLLVLVAAPWAGLLENLVVEGSPREVLGQGAGFLWAAGLATVWLVVAVHYVLLEAEVSRRAEQRAVESRLLAREAELRALKMQIDPHFLFNSLNTVSALVGQDPAGARAMLGRLAEFLRRSLRSGQRSTIPLAEEVALVRAYLEVEKVRFGDRLELELVVAEECKEVPVPPLLLQPLVENAIRHGIARCLEGGIVALCVRRRDDAIEIVLENPRDPEAGVSAGQGIGLDNVRRRLRAAYGAAGRLEAEAWDQGFRATLRLPDLG